MKKFVFILLAASMYACDDERVTLEGEIEYGTSFGECVGYCVTEAYIQETEMKVLRKTWNSQNADLSFERTLTPSEWQQLNDGIDVDRFADLPETIGCPDCADGGAEWLELTVNGERKRVTFEYMTEVEGINPAIEKLRELVEEAVEDQ
ncbi:hypothetical protein [Marinoscillum sp.]|uniref:hypothetical protein n=1 Tax=Marinoscillum sp. TaxID=2024838 RepID=UPI003BAB1A17